MNYAPEHNLYPMNPGLLMHGTDTVLVRDRVAFDQINECIGVPMVDLEFFNPQFTKRVVPGSKESPYALRMPTKYTLRFTQLEDSIYSYVSRSEKAREIIEEKVEEVSDSFVHVVKKGESLGSVARKYHVTVAKIKKWNHLKRETLHVGQRLTIYRSGSPMAQVNNKTTKSSAKSAKNSSKATKSAAPKTHTVKKGETLSSISRKYGCTVNDLKKWNNLKGNSVKVGQKLKIKK
jgi:membrane-bound lytic murein transglycosylase D